jgi:hypothetical protein
MSINLGQLVVDMQDAASNVLQKDVSTLRGFSARQLKAIAQQASLVGGGIAAGQITEETQDFFLDSLEDMALSFVRTLRGLVLVTVEKVWNAVVNVIWAAISGATGLTLVAPSHDA